MAADTHPSSYLYVGALAFIHTAFAHTYSWDEVSTGGTAGSPSEWMNGSKLVDLDGDRTYIEVRAILTLHPLLIAVVMLLLCCLDVIKIALMFSI